MAVSGADTQWTLCGADAGKEKSRMGVAVSAAFARHRISRIPLIGVPLATLRDRAGMRRVAVGGVHDGAVDPQDFYAYQVRMRDALRCYAPVIRNPGVGGGGGSSPRKANWPSPKPVKVKWGSRGWSFS